MAAEEPVSRNEWLALVAILLLALVLRVIGLNAQLWYDEILTLTDFVRKPYGELVGDFSSLNNHMFYSLQARASILAFGESAWALRLPALLYGMASLVVLWLIGREAAGRRAALLAVLLLAISYHHVWFTQNARGYTALLFWTSLATLLLARFASSTRALPPSGPSAFLPMAWATSPQPPKVARSGPAITRC